MEINGTGSEELEGNLVMMVITLFYSRMQALFACATQREFLVSFHITFRDKESGSGEMSSKLLREKLQEMATMNNIQPSCKQPILDSFYIIVSHQTPFTNAYTENPCNAPLNHTSR
jgi:hypothetical protein